LAPRVSSDSGLRVQSKPHRARQTSGCSAELPQWCVASPAETRPGPDPRLPTRTTAPLGLDSGEQGLHAVKTWYRLGASALRKSSSAMRLAAPVVRWAEPCRRRTSLAVARCSYLVDCESWPGCSCRARACYVERFGQPRRAAGPVGHPATGVDLHHFSHSFWWVDDRRASSRGPHRQPVLAVDRVGDAPSRAQVGDFQRTQPARVSASGNVPMAAQYWQAWYAVAAIIRVRNP